MAFRFSINSFLLNFNISILIRMLGSRNSSVNARYVVGYKRFRPDIQKPRQVENAVRDI